MSRQSNGKAPPAALISFATAVVQLVVSEL